MNTLITGANGFIGSNLCNLLPNEHIKIFKGTRDSINLYSLESVKSFIDQNEIEAVVHCAIEGGHKNKPDTSDIVYKNLLMFENISHFDYKVLINIGSGAEFDRSKNIDNSRLSTNTDTLFNAVPKDYYGFSKNLIAKKCHFRNHTINLRLFGCFYHNELNTRFIRANIERYIRKEPMFINQNKYMDFFYMEDLASVIKNYLIKAEKYELTWFEHDMNMTYNRHIKLSDVANIINKLSDYTVDIVVGTNEDGDSYIGNNYGVKIISSGSVKLKGLEQGIKECYERLK